jgi:hypothetical protein
VPYTLALIALITHEGTVHAGVTHRSLVAVIIIIVDKYMSEFVP